MSEIFVVLATAILAASALVALVLTYKPGVSERTRQTAFYVLVAATLLTGVAYLVAGDMLSGAVLIATVVLILIVLILIALRVKRLDRRNREKSTK